jgi:hypothetical protein
VQLAAHERHDHVNGQAAKTPDSNNTQQHALTTQTTLVKEVNPPAGGAAAGILLQCK